MRRRRSLAIVLLLALAVSALGQQGASVILGPQVPFGSTPTPYFDDTERTRGIAHATAFAPLPPAVGQPSDLYMNAQYYDLALCLYVLHARTGDPAHLALARKVADSWWQFSPVGSGTTPIENSFAPRNSSIGGLMLRALDGRPEMWDWIAKFTRYQFDSWIKRFWTGNALGYGVRDGSYMLLYATWLGRVLPDNYPLADGTMATNGAFLRTGFTADAEKAALDYYVRLQQPDGSWRWDDTDVVMADGGTLKGIMQPFMVGLLLHALIDVYRTTPSAAVQATLKASILKSLDHLYDAGPYMKRSAGIPNSTLRWRAFNYFYHGGTTVNPTKYVNGDYAGLNAATSYDVEDARQATATLLHAYAWAYATTGDAKYATMADDLFDSIFGFKEDPVSNYVAGNDPKGYNQHYRAAGRFLAWRYGSVAAPTPTPSPSPTPSPTPVPTPTPSPTRQSAWFNWPSKTALRQSLWDQKVKEGWNCSFVYDNFLYCWK